MNDKANLDSRKNQLKATAIGIVKRLRENGFSALFAGGCVRDMLMGSIPEDYDIATDANPDDIISIFKRTVPIGIHFGVILVIENDFAFEVATFRSDGTYSDGRHPDTVTFCDASGDALRRDFTINGMFYDPIEDKHFDCVGGEDDLKARLIRAIGNPFERFNEDRLRMIRAVRFACQFDFKIEEQTAEAIKKLHHKILTVSSERIRDELRKTLTGPNPDTSIKMLDELNLLHEILPEVTAMKGVAQPENFHPEGDVFTHTLLTLTKLADGRKATDTSEEHHSIAHGPGKKNVSGSWELAMAVLLHDIGKPVTFEIADRIRFNNHDSVGAKMTEKICERLRMSNAEKERITWLVRMHLYLRHAQEMRISKLKRLFAHEGYPELAELYKVDSLASTANLDDYNFCQNMFEELKVEEIKPEPLITGSDLIALGLKPGPIFAKILDAIKDEQLEQKITTKKEALKKAKELVSIESG
ncbi:MAG: CCA tRNA nucleotidyltransferase [Candidatus Scalindua rubra]|uniref:Poly(A) polymerase n=1 Tax=Candidatus Scalindua brodae TaxID=237368 RepID=A0A0B0EPX0_9BACT|nr:MAG: poly(A) polymerase [Candidatus Scalindua brodae]MBZ0109791.1 CCA tRNA nucleotidyltransferase [Candidatus Scalindua rubra]TWU32336.1 CCA-adding enzyme [Candidatus Brocadiaceae bacterium S225]